jgi:hypothetical protein
MSMGRSRHGLLYWSNVGFWIIASNNVKDLSSPLAFIRILQAQGMTSYFRTAAIGDHQWMYTDSIKVISFHYS